MPLSRRIARPLLASIFVVGGFDAVRNPAGKAGRATSVTEPVLDQLPTATGLDTETMVRVNGAVQVVAGVLLAVGKFRRLACVALMGSIVPTTYAGHRFWEETDDTTRKQQMMHFFKNVGLLGGLILAAVDTEGAPSLSWRAKRRLHALEAKRGSSAPHDLGARSQAIVIGASKQGRRAMWKAQRAGDLAGQHLKDVGLDSVHKVADGRTGALLANTARQLEPLAENTLRSGVEIATEALTSLGEHLPSR